MIAPAGTASMNEEGLGCDCCLAAALASDGCETCEMSDSCELGGLGPSLLASSSASSEDPKGSREISRVLSSKFRIDKDALNRDSVWMGCRKSWLAEAKKRVFALLADSASCNAFVSRLFSWLC